LVTDQKVERALPLVRLAFDEYYIQLEPIEVAHDALASLS